MGPAVTLTSTFTTATIFDIHLLQGQICSELTPRDLRRCCLVSRDFYHYFVPYLYRDITIARKATYNKFYRPEALVALERNRDHVLSVNCVFAKLWKILLDHRCFNLRVLKSPSLPYRLQNREENKLELHNIIALMRSCPLLRVVELGHFFYMKGDIEAFCSVMRNHDQLREVKIDHHEYVSCQKVRRFLWSSTKLHRLSLNIVMTYNSQQFTSEGMQSLIALSGQEDPVFAMKELDLRGRMHDHEIDVCFLFLRRCPNLERLTSPSMYTSKMIHELASIISSTMPYLQHLDMRHLCVPADTMALLLSACQNLRSYKNNRCQELTPALFAALWNHQDTLKELNIARDDNEDDTDEDDDVNYAEKTWTMKEVLPRVLYEQVAKLTALEKLGPGRVRRLISANPVVVADMLSSGNDMDVEA
ncbi:hypothetical protein BC939DRAFT_502082 [Gamsiella multidivaricata]|uniref:uncharacterized protein n=1 Tax=Gamsiella multidivaricata TaxID=101098 RepID=UPI002220299E|nr:uncharacterized protein BC939DRAFT_502082 [Gamsiella multidivaricata]KAG0363690.1 hypothetical protein BGZ54_008077 [Gamsiella multidivaricata]KAI7825632.1 hypothetical protein BC939DRAFT_502082 [Gamsiella multidivaricata]